MVDVEADVPRKRQAAAQAALDATLEARLAKERRDRTAEARTTSQVFLPASTGCGYEGALKRRAAIKTVRGKFDGERAGLRARQQKERDLLRNRQSRLYIRIIAILDFTGITRRPAAGRPQGTGQGAHGGAQGANPFYS